MTRRHRPVLAALAGASLLLAAAGPAAAREPRLTVPQAKLAAGLVCPQDIRGAKRQPLLLVTGTGVTGDEAYAIGKGALLRAGHPICYVNFPDRTTADIQVSVQYLVSGIRTMRRRAGRTIAIYGISQGGLLPRWALTYWPSLRPMVSDVIAGAGTQHGTTVTSLAACRRVGCAPAGWQQAAGSNLLKALNAEPDETPGPTAWTTVRSLTDEVAQPQGGRHPTSALRGATNVLIQAVCPGRRTTHVGVALDAVNYAAIVDAIDHRGPAKVSRFPRGICAHPYAPGLDEAATTALLAGVGSFISGGERTLPKVRREPAVQAYAKRRVR